MLRLNHTTRSHCFEFGRIWVTFIEIALQRNVRTIKCLVLLHQEITGAQFSFLQTCNVVVQDTCLGLLHGYTTSSITLENNFVETVQQSYQPYFSNSPHSPFKTIQKLTWRRNINNLGQQSDSRQQREHHTLMNFDRLPDFHAPSGQNLNKTTGHSITRTRKIENKFSRSKTTCKLPNSCLQMV